jgi:hypothetical protein
MSFVLAWAVKHLCHGRTQYQAEPAENQGFEMYKRSDGD